jgi:hypothetical protein
MNEARYLADSFEIDLNGPGTGNPSKRSDFDTPLSALPIDWDEPGPISLRIDAGEFRILYLFNYFITYLTIFSFRLACVLLAQFV